MSEEPGYLDLGHSVRFSQNLRYILFKPEYNASWVFSDVTQQFLEDLWRESGEEVIPAKRRMTEVPDAIEPEWIAGQLVRVIRCPTPRDGVENHFIAIALTPGRKSWLPWRRTPPRTRYLTLERSVLPDGILRTVLCEWVPEGQHINYGSGPEPVLEEFRNALPRLLDGRQTVAATMIPPRPRGS